MSEEKKQTGQDAQKALLIILLTGGLAAVIYLFVLTPMYESYDKHTSDAREIIARTETARKEIRDVTAMNSKFDDLCNYLDPVTNNFVVREELGSYPMERRINEISLKLGLKITSCSTPRKEKTPVYKAPPAPNAKKPSSKKKSTAAPKVVPCFDRLVLDLGIEGGYYAVADLIKELESENPFCGVRDIKITPNASNPERHKVQITLEWPVNADPPTKDPHNLGS